MVLTRQDYKKRSNNEQNANKNICTLAVAQALGVAHNVKYLHLITDVVRAARSRYTVRSRFSKIGNNKSVGSVRNKLKCLAESESIVSFIIRVDGHALLLDRNGKTIVDTAPRKNDRRKITHLYAVFYR